MGRRSVVKVWYVILSSVRIRARPSDSHVKVRSLTRPINPAFSVSYRETN